MKGADIEVGGQYLAKVDWSRTACVEVIEKDLPRKHGYQQKVRNDGVKVRAVRESGRPGTLAHLKVGDEKVIGTRDIERPWTEEDTAKRDAHDAAGNRAAKIRERLEAVGFEVGEEHYLGRLFDVTVNHSRATFNHDGIERLLDAAEAAYHDGWRGAPKEEVPS